MHSSTSLATRLNILIHSANSQKEVARLAQVSDGTFINWLRGHGVRESKLRQVARNLGVSFEWLRDGVGDTDDQLAAFQAKLHPEPPRPGDVVRAARDNEGISQKTLAARLSCGVAFVDLLEHGKVRPTQELITLLCRAMSHLSRNELLTAWGYPPVDNDGEEVKIGEWPDGTKGHFVPLIPSTQVGTFDVRKSHMMHDHAPILTLNLKDFRAFAVKVSGNSMEPVLREGDLVVCSPALKISNGDAAVVRTRSEQVFIKYWQKDGDLVVLASAHPEYKPIELPRAEVVGAWPIVQAIVVGKMRRP